MSSIKKDAFAHRLKDVMAANFLMRGKIGQGGTRAAVLPPLSFFSFVVRSIYPAFVVYSISGTPIQISRELFSSAASVDQNLTSSVTHSPEPREAPLGRLLVGVPIWVYFGYLCRHCHCCGLEVLSCSTILST